MPYAVGTVIFGGAAFMVGWENPIEILFSQVAFVVFAGAVAGTRAWVIARRQEREVAEQAAWILDMKADPDLRRGLHH